MTHWHGYTLAAHPPTAHRCDYHPMVTQTADLSEMRLVCACGLYWHTGIPADSQTANRLAEAAVWHAAEMWWREHNLIAQEAA